jgi:hypothetical protein
MDFRKETPLFLMAKLLDFEVVVFRAKDEAQLLNEL